MQATLEQHLLADPVALVEQGALLDRPAGADGREPVGDHQLGVEERAQHAVGHQHARAPQRGGRVGGPGGDQRELVAQLGLERVAVGEEELELEQVADPLGLGPAGELGVVGLLLLRSTASRARGSRG